nr:immunoglobulin heavy chain junction region [Macaca mulatta]MOV86733.1 immunoglobulin heavy chain junction region [Macaca mulatta]MOV87835.1 immunoglobulin heavy chain junction region [Macaca mulatta]MOV88166.1 immunoglobulin heavy chain junction region [Macaca mulatta]MOV88580.1 immunoglobulin heavy chain junction region [Macaca mulatta]
CARDAVYSRSYGDIDQW